MAKAKSRVDVILSLKNNMAGGLAKASMNLNRLGDAAKRFGMIGAAATGAMVLGMSKVVNETKKLDDALRNLAAAPKTALPLRVLLSTAFLLGDVTVAGLLGMRHVWGSVAKKIDAFQINIGPGTRCPGMPLCLHCLLQGAARRMCREKIVRQTEWRK